MRLCCREPKPFQVLFAFQRYLKSSRGDPVTQVVNASAAEIALLEFKRKPGFAQDLKHFIYVADVVLLQLGVEDDIVLVDKAELQLHSSSEEF